MSHARFRVNPQSIVAGMSRNSLLEAEIWSLSDYSWTRTHNHLVRKQTFNHLAFIQSNIVRAVLEIFWFCFQFLLDKRLLLVKT